VSVIDPVSAINFRACASKLAGIRTFIRGSGQVSTNETDAKSTPEPLLNPESSADEKIVVIQKHWLKAVLDEADPNAFEWSWIDTRKQVKMQVAGLEALEDLATDHTHTYKCIVACMGKAWEMYKRYSQFEKLWADLEQADSDGCSDMNCPSKSLITLGILDADGLEQRCKDLDKFARAVMSRMELLNKAGQVVVWHFLGVHRIFPEETGASEVLASIHEGDEDLVERKASVVLIGTNTELPVGLSSGLPMGEQSEQNEQQQEAGVQTLTLSNTSTRDEVDPNAFEWSWIDTSKQVKMQVAGLEALEASSTHTYKCIVACMGKAWEMYKRYSQFEKLWADLEQADSDGCSDMNCPSKSLITLGILDADGLEQRCKDLDKFARAVMSRMELLNKAGQVVVWHFLGVHRTFPEETGASEVLAVSKQESERDEDSSLPSMFARRLSGLFAPSDE
jgi:hypothetical protein